MNGLSMQTWLVDAAAALVGFAANWLLQSTLLIAVGLSIGWLLRRWGSAVQSAVYRTTLLAVIVCPLATSLLALVGIPGWALDMPAAWSLEPYTGPREVLEADSTAIVSAWSDAPPVPAEGWPAVALSEFSAGAEDAAGVVREEPQQHVLAALPVANDQDVNHPSAASIAAGNDATTHVTTEMGQFQIRPFGLLAVGISLLGLAVAAVLLIRLVMAWRQMNRLRSTAVIADAATQRICQELAALLSVSAPQVLRSPYVTSPCLAGLARPAVLLPEADPSLPIRDVMIHELAHLRRRDCHWNLLRQIAGALLFYQPLLWKLARRLEETAEEVCDDFVVQYGGDRNEYAHRLVDIAALASTPASLAGVGIVSLRSILAKRVTRILDTSRSLSTRTSNQLLAVVITGGLALTLVVGLVGLGPHAAIAEAAADKPSAATPEGRAEENAAADEAEFTAREKSRAAGGDKANDQSSKTVPISAAAETGIVTGRVTHGGQPAAGAHVAIIGTKVQPNRGGDLSPGGEVIAAGIADENGHYQLSVAGASSKTHRYVNLIARKEGTAIAWRMLNLDSPETEVALELPAEEPIRGKLIDIEGQPAAGVTLKLVGVQNVMDRFGQDGVGYPGGDEPPAAWLPPVTSDGQGRFTIRGVPAGHGVHLHVVGSDRFAPQGIALNTGMPEQRGERDRTYRSLVQNVEPGEEAVLTLPPAQWFEGVVRYEDSGEPVAHARVTIWASQEESSSMISVSGQADKQGRYRINPKPGVRFGVTAYPPAETAYLARQTLLSNAIRWEAGDRVKQVDIALPRGVLVHGTIKEAETGRPVAGAAVQYLPQSANNPNASDDILTGWQNMQLSDEAGRFSIAVLPGPGHLLIHGQDRHVLQEIGSRQLDQGQPGGVRNYAHAIEPLDPDMGAEPLEVAVELKSGGTVAGRIVDPQGELVEEALVISRLKIFPTSLRWRGHTLPTLGGRFELAGLADDREYLVHFLDARRQLGATANFKTGGPEQVDVVLQPCGKARLRTVNGEGEPVVGYQASLYLVVTPGALQYDNAAMQRGELAADADFVQNVDRSNHGSTKSDPQGSIMFPALIPGAHYQILSDRHGQFHVAKEFQAQASETLDLGDLVVERPK